MSSDIEPIISDWPYRPDEITVRVIEGLDGQRKIQLRLDLGVLQMEFDGRPDIRSHSFHRDDVSVITGELD